MASEALAGLFEGYVVQLGPSLPCFLDNLVDLDLIVVDPGALLELEVANRCELVRDLQRRSRPGGVHVLLPCCANLAPEALLSLYEGWELEEMPKPRRRTGAVRRVGLLLTNPEQPRR